MILLRAFRLAASLVAALGLLTPLMALAQAAGLSRLAGDLQVALCRVLLAGLGLRVSGPLSGSAPALLVANHVSWLDVLVIGSRIPICFLAKSEVAGWPVIGALARLRGTVFVDRARRRTIVPANAAIAARLRAGQSIVLFPEGTTSDAGVLPFRSSHLASLRCLLETEGAPRSATVQALAIRFSHPVAAWVGEESLLPHLLRVLKAPALHCTLHVAEEWSVAPGFDRKALSRALHAEVTALLASESHLSPEPARTPPSAAGLRLAGALTAPFKLVLDGAALILRVSAPWRT